MTPDALSIHNLHVSYQSTKAVTGLNLQAPAGQMTCIVGPNGSGKSTTLKASLNLVDHAYGTVRFFGKPLKKIRHRIGYVPQRSTTDWDFPINVIDTVLLGTFPNLRTFQRPGVEQHKIARNALERVNMTEFANRQISDLSGGQQQRVFIARSLAQQADLLLLDEPLIGIDATTEADIIGILTELCAAGKSVVMVHHDLSNVEEYFDRIVMVNQKLVAQGPVQDVLTSNNLRKTFVANLLGLPERVE